MERVNRSLLLAVLVIAMTVYALTPSPTGVAAADPDLQAIDRFVQAQMQKHRIPGLALAITQGDAIIFASGYGMAGPGRPMTPDTPMSIGSTSKAITAVAIMQLVEQGELDLDAPVRAYLPWFRVADEHASATITVRHLLHHTSGLSEYGYNKTLPPETSMEAAVRDLRTAQLSAPVGTTFHYFNPHYATLGLIIEAISGQSYATYVQQHIFAPLHMAHSYTDPVDALRDGLAQGHSKLFGFPIPRNPPFRQYMLAEGSLISTARDMSRFLLVMQHQGLYGDTRVLSPGSVEALQTPPSHVENTSYGMGWTVGTYRDTKVVHAAGAAEAFMSQAFLLPERGQGIVVLLNQEHVLDHLFAFKELNDGILDVLMGQAPRTNGISMQLIGWVMLVGFLMTTSFVIRSVAQARGWPDRARALPRGRLLRAIAPDFIAPVVTLIVVFQAGSWLFGRPFNLAWVGFYYVPDVLLWLVVGTVPDLLVGLYKTVVVVGQRSPAIADGRPSVHLPA